MVLENSKKEPTNDQVINTDYTREKKKLSIEAWQVILAAVCSTTALKIYHTLRQELGYLGTKLRQKQEKGESAFLSYGKMKHHITYWLAFKISQMCACEL